MGDVVGERLGHFQIVAKLGQGGMGVVYRAVDEKLRRTVALKLMPADFARDPERRRRFLREARSAAAVTHATIAAIYDVGEEDGRLYIAMELCEGKTLRERMREARLPVADALRIARDVARGLARAHEKGIVHRDLKPDNLMIDGDLEVKILDFGLAKLREAEVSSKSEIASAETASHVTQEGTVLGTPGYMSPEQATGREVDHRTDLFSLGVILYEMLAGLRPFGGDSPMEVAIAIARDTPKPASQRNQSVSPEIDRILDRCLAKKPDERYASARELQRDLEALLTDSRSASSQPIAIAPSPRGRFLALGVAALAVAGIAALALVPRKQHPVSLLPLQSGLRALTDLPPPATTNAEALAAYKRGLQSFRDGSWRASEEFERAWKLDPTLTAARFRLALTTLLSVRSSASLNKAREHFVAATADRASLSAHDQVVLEAMEPMFRDQFRPKIAEERLIAALARFPDDVELTFQLGLVRFWRGDLRESQKTLARAIEIDPAFGGALYRHALSLGSDDRLEGAIAELDRCAKMLPGATVCFMGLAYAQSHSGQCTRAEDSVRQLIALDPSEPDWQIFLGSILAAEGKPEEAVAQAFHRGESLASEAQRRVQALEDAASLATLRGDLAGAERNLRERERALGDTESRNDRIWHSTLILAITAELGRGAEAGKEARNLLRAAAAWPADPRMFGWEEMPLVAAAKLGGAIDGAELARDRDRRLKSYREQLIASVGNARGVDYGRTWIDAWAAPAESPEEVQQAMAALPEYLPLPGRYFRDAAEEVWAGRAFVLAGRADDALPLLQSAVQTCHSIILEEAGAVAPTQAYYWVGRAKELKSDREGACAAYRTVLERWGKLKRSVTAELARKQIAALGCK
jgi:serine/threonine-protein kinase